VLVLVIYVSFPEMDEKKEGNGHVRQIVRARVEELQRILFPFILSNSNSILFYFVVTFQFLFDIHINYRIGIAVQRCSVAISSSK